jgi:hypothetical protein
VMAQMMKTQVSTMRKMNKDVVSAIKNIPKPTVINTWNGAHIGFKSAQHNWEYINRNMP